jgi:hypothetical protein
VPSFFLIEVTKIYYILTEGLALKLKNIDFFSKCGNSLAEVSVTDYPEYALFLKNW